MILHSINKSALHAPPCTTMRPPSTQSMYRVPSYMRSSTGLASSQPGRPLAVPQDFLVRDLKEKRKFRLLSRKLTLFVTFVVIYVVVLLLDRNISGRSAVRRIIANELLETSHAESGITFSGIHSIGAFWDWLANSFMATVYARTDSQGLAREEDEMYTIASHTVIVGGFNLLQRRYRAVNISSAEVKGDQCYSTLQPVQGLVCYSIESDSEDDFGHTNGTNSSLTLLDSLDMFRYSDVNNTGGFQTLFGRSTTDGEEERRRIQLMQEFRWVDRQTRLIDITMPLYNRNLKLWSVVHLTISFDLAGGVTPKSRVHVTNLEPYDFTSKRNLIRGILEIVFVLHVVYFLLLELWDICVLSNGSFRVYVARYGLINNLGDWGNIVINATICLWRYSCQTNDTRNELLAIQSFDEYVPAGSLVFWDELLLALNICNVLLLTARTLKYFQVTDGGRRLMYSVYGAMPEVFSFLPIYLAVIVGYTFAGHMLYGLSFPEWSTFPRALFRVFELNFGLYDPGPIYDAGGYLSAIFIYSSNVVFCILMLNVFMAIVMSTWEQLSEKEAEKAQERAAYSKNMSISDIVHLIFMKEDVVDTLLDIAMDLEGTEKVTLAAYEKAWRQTGMEVSQRTWERITHWYWDPSTVNNATDDDKRSAVLRAGTLGLIEATDDVKVINSARDLSSGPESTLKPKSAAVAPSRSFYGKPSTAKVLAEATPKTKES